MRDPPKLEPQTKERWAGIRSEESMVSEIQDDLNEIRSRVSGIDRYQDFLETIRNGNDDFATYETNLESRASDRPDVSTDEVEEARNIVSSAFADFGSFAGDPNNNTGVFGLSDFDGYRTYLTNNGVAAIDADVHLQAIQPLFQPGDTFIDAALDFNGFDELETWLKNNGWTAAEAEDFVDRLKDQFSSYTDFLNRLNELGSIDELLNDFDHGSGDPGGGPRVERRDGVLYLYGTEIRMRELSADAINDPEPPDGVSWTMDTSSKTVDIGDTVLLEATGSSATTGKSFEVNATLSIEERVRDKQIVTVRNGSTSARFEYTFDEPGEFKIQINDATAIIITVKLAT